MTGLDDILSGSPTQETPPSAPVRADPGSTPDRAPPGEMQTDFGSDKTLVDDRSERAVPPAAEQEASHVPVQALKDERRKRQELERRMQAYEANMRQAQQQPPPDVYQDPEGALSHVRQQFQHELTRTRLDMSVAMARTQHQDYEDAETAFIEAVHANPNLYNQMLNDPHPAGFAYRVGKQVQAYREIGSDPVTYRDKVRQEIEAERGGTQRPRSSLPPSLASARDTNGRFAPAWGGPTPLKDILSPRK